MTTPNNPRPFLRVTAITVSPGPANSATRLASGELRVGPRRHQLIRDQDGTLRQEFSNLELSSEVPVTLRYTSKSLISISHTQPIDIQPLLASSVGNPTQEISVVLGSVRVTFNCQATEIATPTTQPAEPLSTTYTLIPTTQAIIEECPRFRILVIGKSGVGKSSLINITFGINKTSASDLFRGQANIEEGLESLVNKHFILHDSLGFEPGDKGNYETVESFIRSRQTGPLKDQLHAVWFCVQAPRTGDRLLEVAAENFFKEKKKTMGTIPLTVVYTKFDSLVDDVTMDLVTSAPGQRQQLEDQNLAKEARSRADSRVQQRHHEINRFAGDTLPHAVVSTAQSYKYTLEKLVNMTYRQVETRETSRAQATVETYETPGAQATSVVMAQRVDPHLKIQGCINVGKQRYWKTLGTNPNFEGHTIWECLSVIHADITAVWNFNDPNCRLADDNFKKLVVEMAREIETRPAPKRNIAKLFVSGGSSLASAIPGLLAIIANPAAPVIIPVVVGTVVVAAAAAWFYTLYQNMKNVQPIFMTFIVDMTHIMKTLFILTGRDHNKLTRRAIKVAYQTYHESCVMHQVHSDIQGYVDGVGRDAALEMIESLIKLERNADPNVREYYAELERVDVRKLNLDQEEGWK